MRPLKPINHARHNSASQTATPISRLYLKEPEYTGRQLKPIVPEDASASVMLANNAPPLHVAARFGKLQFMSQSINLISNDGWKSHTLDVSLRLAYHFAYKERRRTLYMNSMVRQDALTRKFKDLAGTSHKASGMLHLCTDTNGMAGVALQWLADAIIKEKIEVIIINSWEFGGLSSKDKQHLLRVLRELSNAANVCIIVFSSANVKTISPGFHRSGALGMLSFLSDTITDLRSENDLLPALYNNELAPPTEEVKPVYMTAPKEKKDESKHIGSIEINDLGEVVGTSLVSDGHLVPA